MIMIKRKRFPPTHPGELLRVEVMPAAKLTRDGSATLLGVSRRTVNEIVKEKRGISADTAHRLGRLFNTTPDLWLGLQAEVDLWKSGYGWRRRLPRIKPLRRKV
jgi:antitoxin HigA-1